MLPYKRPVPPKARMVGPRSGYSPQLDSPAIIVCGPTPERADLGSEVLVPRGEDVEPQLQRPPPHL